jgi:hypothetical protein
MFGTRTHVGYDKYDFPICIVNPLKVKNVKKDILYYLDNQEEETNIPEKESIWIFFGKLNSSLDFDIISVNTDSKNENSFLLQLKDFSKKKCVVFIDKKSKQIVKFEF